MKSAIPNLKDLKKIFLDHKQNIIENDTVIYYDKKNMLNLVKFSQRNASKKTKTKTNRSSM